MRYRTFGNSGLKTSAVGFGAWALGSEWWGETDDPDELVAHALSLGVTYFESGDVYGQGANEELLAAALNKAGAERSQIQLSTKFGYVIAADRQAHSESERPQDFSPQHLRTALEASLKRLGTDYVDLYQLHNPRLSAIESDDLFESLDQLQSEGKIRAYGVALGPAIGWREEGVFALERRDIAALQTVYNMLEREPGDEFISIAERTGTAGIIARVPTASGLLEDNLSEETEFGEKDHRRHRPREWLTEGLKKVEAYRFLTRDGERTLAQAALKFIFAQSSIANVLPTVTNKAELSEWAAAASDSVPDLSSDELSAIDELYESKFARLIGGELKT